MQEPQHLLRNNDAEHASRRGIYFRHQVLSYSYGLISDSAIQPTSKVLDPVDIFEYNERCNWCCLMTGGTNLWWVHLASLNQDYSFSPLISSY